MSGHTAIEAALKSWLTTQGMAPSADHVYSGRRPRRVKDSLRDVWIERLESEDASPSGLHDVAKHVYLVHLRSRPGNAGPSGTGEAQLERGETWAEVMVNQLRGLTTSELRASLGSQLIGANATEETVDEDPEESGHTSFAVRVEIWREVTP